jgi:hypothetical protein
MDPFQARVKHCPPENRDDDPCNEIHDFPSGDKASCGILVLTLPPPANHIHPFQATVYDSPPLNGFIEEIFHRIPS